MVSPWEETLIRYRLQTASQLMSRHIKFRDTACLLEPCKVVFIDVGGRGSLEYSSLKI